MLTEAEIKGLFMNQIDCGSAVAVQFEDETQKTKSELMKACGGFGGGLFCGETCGAIAAANVVISMIYGIDEKGDGDGKVQLIKKVTEFNEKMHEEHSSFLCKDLLGCGLQTAAESGKMMEFCPKFCMEVTRVLKEILNS